MLANKCAAELGTDAQTSDYAWAKVVDSWVPSCSREVMGLGRVLLAFPSFSSGDPQSPIEHLSHPRRLRPPWEKHRLLHCVLRGI